MKEALSAWRCGNLRTIRSRDPQGTNHAADFGSMSRFPVSVERLRRRFEKV
jgi:hypothetical protein